jgi:hypothetical protein
MGLHMADKHFVVCGQGSGDRCAHRFANFIRAFVPQLFGQAFQGRQVVFSGPAPGNILHQEQNVFGPSTAFGIFQGSGMNDAIQIANGGIHRTTVIRHFSSLYSIVATIAA